MYLVEFNENKRHEINDFGQDLNFRYFGAFNEPLMTLARPIPCQGAPLLNAAVPVAILTVVSSFE